jgi:hypothetical protein
MSLKPPTGMSSEEISAQSEDSLENAASSDEISEESLKPPTFGEADESLKPPTV